MSSWWNRRWFEIAAIIFFTALCVASQLLFRGSATSNIQFGAASNAMLSIGTSGLAAFLFYYLVNERLERRRRTLLHRSLQSTYRNAKWNIALAVILASRKGGRTDLDSNFETIEKALSVEGFTSLFEGGREAHEGYYAFENQMSDQTYEYDEIIFNLKTIVRAAERLVDGDAVDDEATYSFFVRLTTLVARIERNGAGYDESKPLCGLIWEIFAGQNTIQGDLGYDPVQRAIDTLSRPGVGTARSAVRPR